jgi:AraC-like DNA-binding protein
LFLSHSIYWTTYFIAPIPSFFLLVGPSSYLYVRSILTDNATLKKTDYLHFFIFILAFLGAIPFVFTSWQYKIEVATNLQSNQWNLAKYRINKIVPNAINQAIRPPHIILYMILQWRLVYKAFYKKSKSLSNAKQTLLIKRWMLLYCSIFSVMAIAAIFIVLNNLSQTDKTGFISNAYIPLLFCTIGFIMLILALMIFPNITYGLPISHLHLPQLDQHQNVKLINVVETNQTNNVIASQTKENDTQKDGIETNVSMQLLHKDYVDEIEALINNKVLNKFYLNLDCSLNTLSIDINVPTHHLTYFFNEIMEIKFIDWRNNLRIEYAIELFKKDDINLLTIEAIAQKSGFSAHSTFIRAFKNKTSKTPSEYIKQIKCIGD